MIATENFEAALAELKAANAANTVRVYATSMLRAQGIELSVEDRAMLVRVADAVRAVLGTGDSGPVNVPVYDAYQQNIKIGELQFTL